jgi:hypothetical protein
VVAAACAEQRVSGRESLHAEKKVRAVTHHPVPDLRLPTFEKGFESAVFIQQRKCLRSVISRIRLNTFT